MRNQRVRFVFIVLIVAIPMLIEAASASSEHRVDSVPRAARASLPISGSWRAQAVQAVVLIGLTLAGKERTRILAQRQAPG